MSRSYRAVNPHASKVYSAQEVRALYSVCRNTVSNWVSAGLVPSVTSPIQLFRGAELIRFHDERKARTSVQLRLGEFKCLRCKAAVFPEIDTVSIRQDMGGKAVARATCCDCGAKLNKRLGATERDRIQNCLDTNTKLSLIDEDKDPLPADIGKDAGSRVPDFHTVNDKVVHDWQHFAGRYSQKTVHAHLVSIRDFERFLDGKSLANLTVKDAGAYRDHLVRLLALQKEEGGLSGSTVRHRASHLARFTEWLTGQDGFRRLSSSIPSYFALPRASSAKQKADEDKVYPTLDQAWDMVDRMPKASLIERRNRAMVAFAFVSGFRAAALTALRLKHVDMDAKTVSQVAGEMPAKNGKSYTARWFPRTEACQEVFVSWVNDLKNLGFQAEDALFPPERHLKMRFGSHTSIEPLGSSKPLQSAFTKASAAINASFTPHSARHTLKALGGRICRTHEERKAWSLMLGHSNEQITDRHYGKMSQTRSFKLIDALSSEDVFTDEEKEIIMDYREGRFHRGTVEYMAARRLAEKREKARGDADVTLIE